MNTTLEAIEDAITNGVEYYTSDREFYLTANSDHVSCYVRGQQGGWYPSPIPMRDDWADEELPPGRAEFQTGNKGLAEWLISHQSRKAEVRVDGRRYDAAWNAVRLAIEVRASGTWKPYLALSSRIQAWRVKPERKAT